VGRRVVEHDVHLELGRHRRVDQVQEAAEPLGAVAWRQLGEHLAGGHIKRGVEVGDAVWDVVMAWRAGTPGIKGSTGAERSSAWICDFSSRQSTTAASGGLS
jgi:hypothetical protein